MDEREDAAEGAALAKEQQQLNAMLTDRFWPFITTPTMSGLESDQLLHRPPRESIYSYVSSRSSRAGSIGTRRHRMKSRQKTFVGHGPEDEQEDTNVSAGNNQLAVAPLNFLLLTFTAHFEFEFEVQ
jgi:hypothetical protein